MKITIENGKETVISLSGQLDTLTSIDLEKEIAPILQGEAQTVVLDGRRTDLHQQCRTPPAPDAAKRDEKQRRLLPVEEYPEGDYGDPEYHRILPHPHD